MTWTPDQFWEFVEGYTGAFEAGQIREILQGEGLAVVSLRGSVIVPEWQDISTAPKDGFEIDLWCLNVSDGAEARFAEMFWNESGKWEDWCSYTLEPKWKPTHWMKAPKGPSVTRHDLWAESNDLGDAS